MLLATVPTLDPFATLSADTRLWLRWVEPHRDDAQLEIASAARDEPPSTARALARAAMPDRWGAWALFRLAQVQGGVDLLLASPEPSDSSPAPFLKLPLCVDLSQPGDEPGVSPDADSSLPTMRRPARFSPHPHRT